MQLEPLKLTADGTVFFNAAGRDHAIGFTGDLGGGSLAVIEAGATFQELGMDADVYKADNTGNVWEAVTDDNGVPIAYVAIPPAALAITMPKRVVGFRLTGSTNPNVTIHPERINSRG